MTPDEVRFMKTIQIPTTSNPFIVNINNQGYSYRAGATVEVPNEVAAAIEDALDLEPKPKRHLSRIGQLAEGSITELTTSDLDGAEKIAKRAFEHCQSIKRVELPNCITSIGSEAFFSCESINLVTIGNGVKQIATYAFYGCIALARVALPEIPPVLEDVNAFNKIKTSCTFYCKTKESLDAYKAAANWSTLAGTYAFAVEA